MSTDDPFKTGGGLKNLEDVLATTDDPLVGQTIGSYRVQELIAEGGMGRVYRATRDDGQFDREVAIKILPPGMGNEHIKRFEQEQKILASLSHPNIAQLYDAGFSDASGLFLVMELIDGHAIDSYVRENALRTNAKIRLMLTLCEALTFAHAKLVVHRDLKPSNVFVSSEGQLKLLDFGIAKILEAPSDVTVESRPMTPRYASPEQLLNEPVSVASDIYQLGLLFLSLYTRRPELPDDTLESAVERVVKDTPLTAASQIVETLPVELTAIINKCLRIESDKRYASATELAADLRNYLGGYPVSARNPGTLQKGLKFAKRNLPTVVVSSFAFLAIVVGSIAYTISINEARGIAEAERDEAERQAEIARESLGFLTTVLTSADPNVAQRGSMTIREALDAGVNRIATELADQPEIQSRLYLDLSNTYQNLGDHERQHELIDLAEEPTLEVFGADSEEFLRLRLARGNKYYQSGEYAKGKAYLENLVEQASSTIGAGHITTLRARSSLSNNLWGLGDMQGFADVSAENLQYADEALGSGDEFTLNAAHNVAIALVDQGKYDEAIELASEYADIADSAIGAGHTATLSLLSILASAHGYNGDLDRELELRKTIIGGEIIARGEDHPAVGSAKVNLAYVYNDLNQYDDVERLFGEAVEIWTSSLGPDHPATLRGRRNLAVFQVRHGRNPGALEDLEEVIDLQSTKLGPEHGNTIESRLHLAELLLRNGSPAAAAEIAATSALGDQVLGENSPIMQRFQQAIAEIRAAQNPP